MEPKGVVTLAVAIALVLGGCALGKDPETAPSPSPVATEPETAGASSPTSTAAQDCANADDAASVDADRLGGSVRGDVDGDGEEDRVSLVLDRSGPRGCRAFVVADMAAGALVAPVWEIGPEGGLPRPRLHSLADVDGRPGLEVIVDEAAGASSQFVGLFAATGAGLVRLRTEESGGGVTEDLFPFGGSVGHIESIDCSGPGTIVVSAATPAGVQGAVYDVTRRFLRVRGTDLVETRVEEERVSIDELEAFPEYGAGPFGSC